MLNAIETQDRRSVAGAAPLDRWQWRRRALCLGHPLDDFYPPDNIRGPRRRRHEERAKGICRACEVLNECRRYAVAAQEPYGIWDATTPLERMQLSLEMGVGRIPRG